MFEWNEVVGRLTQRKNGKSYRALAKELDLPESSVALLSKAINGKPLSATSMRRIGRALGVIDPPRTVPRVTPNKAQRERKAAGGWEWHDILEAGLQAMEGGDNVR